MENDMLETSCGYGFFPTFLILILKLLFNSNNF